MKIKTFFKENWSYLVAGLVIGLVALLLTVLGNPANMGFCIACFLRDSAGALGLHSADTVQYLRPEIIGIILGAFAVALFKKDFSPAGGSAPLTRFLLGMVVVTGALVFLGCPLRMLLRIGGGDLNALIGLVGFVGGIAVGVVFLNKGFTLKRSYPMPKLEALIAPASSGILLVVLVLAVTVPSAAILLFSESGPGSQHAPVWAALIGGLLVGIIGQRTRVCFVGGIRDSMLFKQFGMVCCFAVLLVTVIAGNLIQGNFHLSMKGQPIAHTDVIFNIIGLFIVGLGSVFLGGCPFRQLVLTGSGNTDSAVTVLGMVVGAALAHNLKLASSPSGVTAGGMVACGVCLAILAAVGFLNRRKV